MTIADELYDVAVIGFGPTGAVAAALLGKAGLRTLVVDRATGIYDKPRAVALDHEIARVLQSVGLAEAIEPHVAPFTASEYFGVGGRLIRRLDMLPPPHPQAWTPSMVFMQPAVEGLLRAAVAAMPSVDVSRGCALVGLETEPGHVNLELQRDSGPARIARARHVIGCDGASSTVRQLLGLELEDLGFDEPWLVVDVIANERGLARLPATSVQYCEPARPTTFVMCTGAHRRWELMLLPGEDPRTMERPDQVWRLLERWITPDDAMLWRSASYRFHALVARQWRKGRVFIAGDAAHQQPPFLGQGLCQGVRDVANLAWKLERVARGASGDGLLDSYGVERGRHVRALTQIIKSIGGVIGERDPERARVRDDRLIAEAGGSVRSVPRQDLMPKLDAGCLGATPHLARGTLFPQPWIETGQGRKRLDDVAGGGLRIVLAAGFDGGIGDMPRTVEALGGRVLRLAGSGGTSAGAFVEAEGVVAAWFARHGCRAAIVRPDNYVFAVADNSAELLARVGELRRSLA